MKNLILTLLIGFVASLTTSVALASNHSTLYKVVGVEKGYTSTTVELAALAPETIYAYTDNDFSQATLVPEDRLSRHESLSLNHYPMVAISADSYVLRDLYARFYDGYLLKLPKHYLLPEKNTLVTRCFAARMC